LHLLFLPGGGIFIIHNDLKQDNSANAGSKKACLPANTDFLYFTDFLKISATGRFAKACLSQPVMDCRA